MNPEEKAKADGEKSRELINQLAGQQEPQKVEPEEDPAPDEAAPAVETPSQEPPKEPPQTAPEPPKVDWEQKYRSELGRAQAERARQTERIKHLETEIAALVKQVSQAQEKPAEKPSEGGVKPEDFEDYGPEFANLVRKLNAVEEENKTLREKLTNQVNTEIAPLKQNMHRISMERFKSDLIARVPQFEEQDRDPEFIAWLQDSDPYDPAHRARVDVLTESIHAMDVTRTSQFFLDFARETGRFGSNGKKETPPKELQKPQNVQPNASRSTAPPSPKTPKTWTRAEIAAFYNDVARGNFKGSEAEILATKRDIAAANAEGRIRP